MPTEEDETLSWHDREVLDALRRLANARSQVDALEKQLAEEAADPAPSPGDLDELRSLQAEITSLESKSKSRFGGGGARTRIAELEAEERLVLDRLGVSSAEQAFAAEREANVASGVDPTLLEFARRELQSAEEGWEAVQAIEVPDEPDEPDDGSDAGEGSDAGGGLASVSDLADRVRRPEAS